MITKKIIAIGCMALGLLGAVSCSSDDGPARAELTMRVIDIAELSNGARYEAWIVVDNEPVSIGTFTSTDADQKFSAIATQLIEATSFFVTVETDNDPEPSDSRYFSGNFEGGKSAEVNVEKVIADFEDVSGKFVLQSPTDDNEDNDQNGIYFMDPSGFQIVPGLNLPSLKQGWRYQAWVRLGSSNQPVTTGKFDSPSGEDASSPYSGNGEAPDFPGEDFDNTAPQGLTFPEDGDIRGKEVFITVEPEPDFDQSSPFGMQILSGNAGQDLSPSINMMSRSFTGPRGTVSKD